MREASDHDVPIAGARRWRTGVHFALSAAMWVTYALYWRVVLVRGVENEARLAGILLAIFLVLQALLTESWITYNRELSRRHAQRRRDRPAAAAGDERDFVGRIQHVFPEGGDLTRVPVILVRVEGDEKIFEGGIPLGAAAEAPRRDEAGAS
ncbi:MAG: hypothetical protein U0167_15600 [bacterium]